MMPFKDCRRRLVKCAAVCVALLLFALMSAGCDYLQAIDESLDAPDVQEDVEKAAKDI